MQLAKEELFSGGNANGSLCISMDDKAYLRSETSEGAKGARQQTILQPSDETRARSLQVHDFPEASVYVTPSAFRFIRKEAEVVEEEVTLVTKRMTVLWLNLKLTFLLMHQLGHPTACVLGGRCQVSTNWKGCIDTGNTRRNFVAYVLST